MLDLPAFCCSFISRSHTIYERHNYPGKSSSNVIKIVVVIKNYKEDVTFRLKWIQDEDHYILFYQLQNNIYDLTDCKLQKQK